MFKTKKFISILLLFFISILIGFPNINSALADAPDCTIGGVIKYTTTPSPPLQEDLKDLVIDFTGIQPGFYRLRVESALLKLFPISSKPATEVLSDLKLSISIDDPVDTLNNGPHVATLIQYKNPTDILSGTEYCGLIKYKIGYTKDDCQMTIDPPNPRENESICITVKNAPKGNWPLVLDNPYNIGYRLAVIGVSDHGTGGPDKIPPFNRPYTGQLMLFDATPNFIPPFSHNFCAANLTIQPAGNSSPRPCPAPVAPGAPGGPITAPGFPVPAFSGGIPCGESPDHPGIATAIGCIHTNPNEFVKDLLTFVIAIGGGLAFLMMLLGAFEMITSNGNPESLANGRSRLTSAVIGLLFIIFAVLLMQIIGVGLLALPEFLSK